MTENQVVSHDRPPTSFQVATAIVAAARETGANPEDVIQGVLATGGPHGAIDVSRARAYAALAIRAVHSENGAVAIARWVGAGSPASYLGSLDHRIKNRTLKWWDDAAFMRVVNALDAVSPEAA